MMARLRFSLGYALLLAGCGPALALAAQDAAAPVQVEPPVATQKNAVKPALPTGRITGTVICADTHRPARGATLVVGPIPAADGTSIVLANNQGMGRVALDGTYSMEHLAPGEYSVVAVLPGYISILEEMIFSGPEDRSPAAIRQELLHNGAVVITAGETQRHDITLVRGAAVSGHVLFSDGSPASQVSIDLEDVNAKKLTSPDAAQAKMGATMSRTLFTHQSQNTDDQGHFRISGLRPGNYRVAAVSSLSNSEDASDGMESFFTLLGGSLDSAALRIYSGDTLHAKAAKTYELRSGDEVTGIDITIPLNAYHVVRGTLTAVDGRAINKAAITLTDTTDDSVNLQAQVSEQGTFAFATVGAGTYTLSAKDAQITAPQEGSSADVPARYGLTRITNAFADGTTSLIVKDSDVSDVLLTLTEVPLPPDANKPPPDDPNE